MYPNPQDVLPLPPHPSLEQYRKLAKDLVKACKSGDPAAIRAWTARWIENLAELAAETEGHPRRAEIERRVEQLHEFARAKLSRGDPQHAKCGLADAQFVIARAEGFESWPKFAKHLEALVRASSADTAFEAAADAIVRGDTATLERRLRDDPQLIHARSAREHRATLLHYVAANGVENYRQKTPRNAVAIAEILLRAGAEVDAEADVYGGGATTLGLAATSAHPRQAGVQKDLIDVLLKHGARLDVRGGGNKHSMVDACLANGCPEAAEYLASRGAPLDLAGAAGIGRLDVLTTFFDEHGGLRTNASQAQMQSALSWACWYGHPDVVDFLLERGMDVGARLSVHGEGQTALHVAAFAAQVDVVKVLLRRGAPVNVTDTTWGTAPLVWALHAWSEEPKAPPERYRKVVAMLVAAGAVVKPALLDDEKVRSDPKMLAALTGLSLEEV